MNDDKHSDAHLAMATSAGGPPQNRRPATQGELPAGDWRGHLPATQAALEHILMRASLGRDDFSLAERVFAQACELRSRIATGGWTTRIGSDLQELEMARYILQALGAEPLSEDLARTVDKVKASVSRHSQKATLRHLEKRLAAQGGTLDKLLAQYAERLWRRPDLSGASG